MAAISSCLDELLIRSKSRIKIKSPRSRPEAGTGQNWPIPYEKSEKAFAGMKSQLRVVLIGVLQTILAAAACFPSHAQELGWLCLTDSSRLQPLPLALAWQDDHQDWTVAGAAEPDPGKPRTLIARPGQGVLISSLEGHFEFRNLTSRQWFDDLEVHVEFLIPKGSNAGVKLQGLYEIQIRDSHGKKQPTASDCGGVYPRAELLPRYHTTDQGVPPPNQRRQTGRPVANPGYPLPGAPFRYRWQEDRQCSLSQSGPQWSGDP